MGQIRKHGGNIIEASEQYNLAKDMIIDYSANINPLGPPPEVYEIIRNNLEEITRYPDSRNLEIKKAIAAHLEISENNVLMGNGASELIFLIINHFQPQNVWIPVPTFSEYEIAASSVKANVIHLPLQGENFSELNLDKLNGMQKGDIIFVCNPNNPTGQLYSLETLEKISTVTANKEAFMIIDESFLDFIENRQELTYIKKAINKLHLIVLYSLTKFFAIPGLRLGAMVSNETIIEQFEKIRDPWNINIFAQLAGQAALENNHYINKSLHFFKEEREFLYNHLKQFNDIIPLKPTANYILIKLNSSITSTEISKVLAKQGILVRNCNSYPLLGEQYIRIAIKKREDNLRLIEELKLIID